MLSKIFNEQNYKLGVLIKPHQVNLPSIAPELWKDYEGQENPADFIGRVYKTWLGKGLTRQHVGKLDKPLYTAFAQHIQRHSFPDYDLPTKKDVNSHKAKEIGLENLKANANLYTALRRKLREPS